MTLEEAIEILTKQKGTYPLYPHDIAIGLGIEALKREQIWRQNDPGGSIHLLPGETKD